LSLALFWRQVNFYRLQVLSLAPWSTLRPSSRRRGPSATQGRPTARGPTCTNLLPRSWARVAGSWALIYRVTGRYPGPPGNWGW